MNKAFQYSFPFLLHGLYHWQRKESRQMKNERLADFLKLAVNHAIDTIAVYESNASLCADQVNRLFLFYLAGKKRVQMVQLMRLAREHALNIEPCFDDASSAANASAQNSQLIEGALEDIQAFATERGRREHYFYRSLAELEEDHETKVFHANLIRQAEAYLADIKKGFTHFVAQRKLRERDTGMYAWPPRAVSRRFVERDVAIQKPAFMCG